MQVPQVTHDLPPTCACERRSLMLFACAQYQQELLEGDWPSAAAEIQLLKRAHATRRALDAKILRVSRDLRGHRFYSRKVSSLSLSLSLPLRVHHILQSVQYSPQSCRWRRGGCACASTIRTRRPNPSTILAVAMAQQKAQVRRPASGRCASSVSAKATLEPPWYSTTQNRLLPLVA